MPLMMKKKALEKNGFNWQFTFLFIDSTKSHLSYFHLQYQFFSFSLTTTYNFYQFLSFFILVIFIDVDTLEKRHVIFGFYKYGGIFFRFITS